jgi:lysozyme family protein
MAKFDDAIELILKHEGGYVNHPNDPGGATNYGISLRFLTETGIDVNGDGLIDEDDIRGMSVDDAKSIYRRYFWDDCGLDECNSQLVANRLFNMVVNMGYKKSLDVLNNALRSCLLVDQSHKSFADAINSANEIEEAILLPALRSEQAAHYRVLAAKNDKFNVFLKGWLNRAYSYEMVME